VALFERGKAGVFCEIPHQCQVYSACGSHFRFILAFDFYLYFPSMIMRYASFLAVLFFMACSLSQPEAPAEPTPPPPPPEPVAEEPMDDMMEMDDMMMHTKALDEGCAALTAKTAEEKTAILEDIAHNMDKDALDLILGKECAFLGEIVEVAEVTDDALKLNPNDDEVLYFSLETNRFFLTCTSMNTLAYVVERSNDDEPEEYFEEYPDEFEAAAMMMKEMIEEMGGMEMMEEMGDMEGMEHMDEMEMMEDMEGMDSTSSPQVEMVEKEEGAYINARDNVALASAAIGNGNPALIFFHASWCGYCQAKDKVLTKLYSENSFSISTYKVDYDTVNDLKARYGITTQDTVVLVDGEGNAVQMVMGATEGDLRSLLSSSS